MKLREIKVIAKGKSVKAGNMKKAELIKAIQKAEGNFDCFETAILGECNQPDCLWKGDCLNLNNR